MRRSPLCGRTRLRRLRIRFPGEPARQAVVAKMRNVIEQMDRVMMATPLSLLNDQPPLDGPNLVVRCDRNIVRHRDDCDIALERLALARIVVSHWHCPSPGVGRAERPLSALQCAS